jgi:olfactory receptor
MYKKCLSQICFVSIFGAMENFLHAVIAYDCYVAICDPLSYMVIMNHYPCILIF